jgi:non-specific serine/threonine protein kinase
MRFRLLETMRQYGSEHHDPQDRARIERAHRDYYLGMTGAALAAWETPEQVNSIMTGRLEKANIMKALEWSLSTPGEAAAALQIAGRMRYHWAIDGSLREGRKILSRALQATPSDAPARPDALSALVWVLQLQGDADACELAIREGVAAARAIGDQRTYARLRIHESTEQMWKGDIARAVSGLEDGLELATRIGDIDASLFASMLLVLGLTEAARFDDAERVAADALAASERAGEVWGRSQLLWALGYSRWVAGDDAVAQDTIHAALALHLDFDQTGRALQLETLGWIAVSRREYTRAATLYGGARELWRRLGTSISAFGVAFAGHSRTCGESMRAALPIDRFDTLAAAGSRLPLGDLIEYAMGHELSQADSGDPRLTRRENEVARLLGEGLGTVEIAERLVLSARTIEGHVMHATLKLGLESRTQLAVWATKRATAPASRPTTAAR